MSAIELHVGAVLVYKDRLVEIICIKPGPSIRVRDCVSRIEETAVVADLSARSLDMAGSSMPFVAAKPPSDTRLKAAQFREHLVLTVLGASGNRDRNVQRIAKRHQISWRSLYRWIALYQTNPQLSSLVEDSRGPKVGSRRLNERLNTLINDVINDHWLVRSHLQPEAIYQECKRRCITVKLEPPSRKAVYGRLRSIDPQKVACAQLGVREARRRHGNFPGTLSVKEPLAWVQIDHTIVDVLVVDEEHRQTIGRPWVSLAIDVATRSVLGFHLSLEAPSALSVALCLTHACLPKDGWLRNRGVATDWPMWGLPRVVHADNAREFKSEALRRGCSEYGIQIELRPVATPHYGGHIERLIGTLMGRVHLLPGTTGSNVATRPSQTERAATLTLAELEKWITIEICEKYHQKIHSSLQTTPLSAWRDSFARDQKAPPVVDDAQMFLLHFLPVERRRLQREGIKLFNIRYWDNILPSIARRGDELLIRYDPRNLSRIYVLATGHHYHIVPYADVRKPPITLWEHAWATKFLRARGERNLDETRIFRAVLEQRRLVEQSSAATKSARRSKQRRKEAQRPSLPVSTPATTAIDYSSPPDEYPAEVWEPRHDR